MFIIMRHKYEQAPSFWTGSGWSPEYPDAIQVEEWHQGYVESNKAMTHRWKNNQDIDWMMVVEHYGMDNERQIHCVPGVDYHDPLLKLEVQKKAI